MDNRKYFIPKETWVYVAPFEPDLLPKTITSMREPSVIQTTKAVALTEEDRLVVGMLDTQSQYFLREIMTKLEGLGKHSTDYYFFKLPINVWNIRVIGVHRDDVEISPPVRHKPASTLINVGSINNPIWIQKKHKK